MSSSERVATMTSSPRRCTWIRMPSSLVSIATGLSGPPPAFSIAASTVVALDASIGSTGRPTSSTNSASASSPPVSAAVDTATVEPAIIAARRTAARRYAARCRQPLLDERVEGTLPDLAGHDPAQPGLLLGGRAPEQLGRRGGPGALRPGAGQRRDPLERLVHLEHRQRRLGGGSGQRLHRPPAQPGAALAQRPGEVGRDRLDLLGARAGDPREQLGERRGLGLARARRGDLGGGGDHVGEQHGASQPARTDTRTATCTSTPDRSSSSWCSRPRSCTRPGTRSPTPPRTGWSGSR